MGENYVLGNRKDDNQFTPYLIDPRMYEENTVAMIACGTQHTVALALASPDGKIPELDKTKFVEIKPKVATPKKPTPKKINGDAVVDDVKSI